MAYWKRVEFQDGSHIDFCSSCESTATAGGCFWDNRTPFCPWCGEPMQNSDWFLKDDCWTTAEIEAQEG